MSWEEAEEKGRQGIRQKSKREDMQEKAEKSEYVQMEHLLEDREDFVMNNSVCDDDFKIFQLIL